MDRKGVSMLDWDVDLLILGSSIAGLSAAYKAAIKGLKTLIVTSDTFLGYELTRWQRPWIYWENSEKELLRQWFPIDNNLDTIKENELVPLHMDCLKRKFEDNLLEVGVEIIYGSHATTYSQKSNCWEVGIGNKAGSQKIKTKWLVDTTESRLLPEPNTECIVHRTIELTNIQEGYRAEYIVPAGFGVDGERVFIYPGAYRSDHILLDIPIRITCNSKDPFRASTEIEYLARKASFDVVKYLIYQEEAFRSGRIGLGSLQVMREEKVNPVKRLKIGEKIIQDILENKYTWDIPVCVYGSFKGIEKGYQLLSGREAEVIVAGGGTSGATAARVAGQEEVKTLLIEMNSYLGGTGTIGGVNRYWFGNRKGYTEEIDKKVGELAAELKHVHDFHIWSDYDEWSIEIKAFILLEMCLNAGVDILFNAIIIDTIMDEQTIKGIIIATEFGQMEIRGKVFIDATGDGDVAVRAGAKYVYGNERDHFPLWYSLAQYSEPGKTKNNFTSSVDVGDIKDYTRCILEGRRRGEDMYDHGAYLAPRETRHIVGDTTITLRDQMLLRHFEDTINICFSNHDPKGRSTADMIYFGLLPPNLEIEIPYRAVLPQKIDGLLIAGKAISATHDAFPAIRMQSDLQNLGGAIGVAAAIVIKEQISPRQIDVRKLQKRLKRDGILPTEYFMKKTSNTSCEWKVIIDNILKDMRFEWLEMDMREKAKEPCAVCLVLFAESEEVIPYLKVAYQTAKGSRKLTLARLLLWHRNEEGLQVILNEIKQDWDDAGGLSKRKGSTRFAAMAPDHGVMPESAYLLYALARSKDHACLSIYTTLVNHISCSQRDYKDLQAGIFHYIDAVAYGAERLGFSEFIPLLKQLLALDELQDLTLYKGMEPDILGERLSYLRLALGRALARCNSKEGLFVLCEILNDRRKILASSAVDELRQLTGLDFKMDAAAWQAAIADEQFKFSSKTWDKVLC